MAPRRRATGASAGALPRYPQLSVASRQQEKERRRQERLEREQAEAASAARIKRLQFVFGGVLVVAIVAGIVAVAAGALGGGSKGGSGSVKSASSAPGLKLPTQRTTSLTTAAKAAGCTVSNPPIEGATHETKNFKPSDYKTNPPTSGNHNPDWYPDGIYDPGNTPRLGMLVHPLEHGRIEVQYKPGTPSHTEQQLEALLNQNDGGYHMLLFQNTTGMKYAVAATAWGHLLACPQMNDRVFDAIRTFRAAWIDKGPEKVP
jgi:uncharacterized protein DUF3105